MSINGITLKYHGEEKEVRTREDKWIPFLYCITLSTYKFFWKKYKSMEQAFYALVKEVKKICDGLRKWAGNRKMVYKLEWWVVLAMDKKGRYIPHVHGFITGIAKAIIKDYICRRWRELGLGYGTFITCSNGHKKNGNIHIQEIDDDREYGDWYGWSGWQRYAMHQQGKIKIGEEEGDKQGKRMIVRVTSTSHHGYEYMKFQSWEKLHEIVLEGGWRNLKNYMVAIRVATNP